MDDCTLTDAIARVAYNREYDGRYNGPPNVAWTEANARALRARDKRYPSNSGLPGTTVLVGLKDETVFAAALQEWKEADRKKWGDAETVLRTELLAGDIRAFDEFGNAVPPEFWLANHLRSRRILLLLRASDIEHLIERQARRIQNEIEEARERMIARFAEKQRRLRDWISFADVADWCARESGSVRPDSRLKADAYRQLGEALARGDFESDGRTRVIFLNPSVRWFKMTRERFDACPYSLRDDFPGVSDLKTTYLECCWIPSDLCRQWFEARRLHPPSWLPRHEPNSQRRASGVTVSEARPPELPTWFSAMEAVAWIVTRNSRIVEYASPERNVIRTYFIEHTLPNGKRLSGNVAVPPGMTLRWLDIFAAPDRDAMLPTDEAVQALLTALRSGRITATATWVATGERRDMGNDEWHGLVLDSPPRNERVLLPHRLNAAALAKQPETRWRDVLIPREGLLAMWPATIDALSDRTRRLMTARQEPTFGANLPDAMSGSAVSAARRRQTRNHSGGRPPKWDWDSFDREIVRLANTPDGLPERARLQRHMLEWCGRTWGDSPAESAVRERIARLYPE